MRSAMSNRAAKSFNLLTPSTDLGYCSNQLRAFTNLFKGKLTSIAPYHLTMEKGEVFRVPSGCQELHVLSGIAWITDAGEDIILTSGEKASLASNKGLAILSALGNVPLILEVL
jgi:hypothetical protein